MHVGSIFRLNYLCSTLLIVCWAASARAQDANWSAFCRSDLQAVHDLLRDNHPGAVDAENSRYREWLETGLAQALQRAESVRSYSDYVRALRFYTNGFQDGHIAIGLEIRPDEVDWPGFIVGPNSEGTAEVIDAQADSGVHRGNRVIECDGLSVDELMKQRIDPYFWNKAIPHERPQHLHRLFHIDARDTIGRLSSCRFSFGEMRLKWRTTTRDEFMPILEKAHGSSSASARTPRLYKVDGVWFVSIPTFDYADEAKVVRIRALLRELSAKASELRSSKVLLDVRRNHGGDSAWGEEVASVIWGSEWVKRVKNSFDNTADWRASDANIKVMMQMLKREKDDGLTDSASYLERTVDAMKAARAQNRPLARVEERPKAKGEPPVNPVSGSIFLLIDHDCASACLDFADLVLRLPNVTHVGLATSADAIYIDNTYALLPSGLTGLGYSMKVLRNRVRHNNEWYEPKFSWPGGEMSDAALAKWVTSLP